MFRISRRLDYGLQLMIELASDNENRAQSTASLSDKLQIPLPFLHQIGHTLMQAGLIKATPGPRGGLRLNQPADSINVLQIVETLEGKVAVNPLDDENEKGSAGTSMVWNELQEKIVSYLNDIRLDQLVQQTEGLSVFNLPVRDAIGKLN